MADRPQKLLTPGPTSVPPSVLRALSEPVLHHRSPDFAAVARAYGAEGVQIKTADEFKTVLARAVKWHVEHRILLNGNRTVVFR